MVNSQEILQKIRSLEPLSRSLDPDSKARTILFEKVVSYAESYLNQLPDRLTYDGPTQEFDPVFPIDENPSGIDGILSMIKQQVDSKGIDPASGGHLGYIPGGGLVPAAWGDYLAAISNRYAGVYFAAPGAVKMENTLIRWLCDLLGYSDHAGGTLTSGGSLANLTAIVNARDAYQLNSHNIPTSVVYITSQIHHCTQKALHIAGLSECVVRYVGMTDFRMDPAALEGQISKDRAAGLQPFMVMASAGTTDTGVVDPLFEIGQIAERNHLWYHIDAAYGGFFLLTEYGRNKLNGIHLADSVIIDPHKGMFLPYGSGALLVKDQRKLYDSQHYFASYMQDAIPPREMEMSPADLSPELSRHFRGMRMYLPLRLFGVAPFRAALEEKLWLARYFYNRLQETDGVEVGPYPDLSVTFFRVIPRSGDVQQFNQQLVQALQADGRVFFSSTTLDGEFYLRLAVLNFRTHLKEIELALTILADQIKILNQEAV